MGEDSTASARAATDEGASSDMSGVATSSKDFAVATVVQPDDGGALHADKCTFLMMVEDGVLVQDAHTHVKRFYPMSKIRFVEFE